MFSVALNVIVLKVIIMLRFKEFSERDLLSFPLYCFPLFLCIVHLGRLSHLCLLFFATLHSDGYIFPFLLCLLLLSFSQLFVRYCYVCIKNKEMES